MPPGRRQRGELARAANDRTMPLLQCPAHPGVERRQLDKPLRGRHRLPLGMRMPAMPQQPALHRQQPGAGMSLHQRIPQRRPHRDATRFQRRHPLLPGFGVGIVRCNRRQGFAAQHVPVARRAQRGRQRAQALQQLGRQRARIAKQPQRRTQPPQRHPRLMHILDVVRRQHPRQIGLELRQTGLDDRGKALLHAHAVVQRQRYGFHRCGLDPMRQAHAALGLADVERLAVERSGPVQRQREQRIRLAGLQFELDLADRLAAFAGHHLADVERHLDPCAALAGNQPGGAMETRLEHRRQLRAQRLRHIGQRLRREPAPIRHPASDRHLEFDAPRQPALPLALGLQRLQPAPPHAPHA